VDAGAIMGDSGDNIHGVDGWGPVTTCKYVREHGGLDAVLEAVRAKGKKSKKEEVLLANEPRMRVARSLKQMDIVPDLPRPRVMEQRGKKELESFFMEHGFLSLMKDSWRLV
jgi:DNA polymerase-1